MNLVADLLCLLACLTMVTCDRVYVHPFNLFTFNESDCDKPEKMVQEGKTIVPVSIESQTTPEYEGDVNDKNKLEAPSLNTWGKEERGYLSDLVYVLGMRFYSTLQKAQRAQNVLLSPTSLYSSLVSFYLGASNQTALDLQGLLGFVPPSGNPDCTSMAVGSNFLSSLRMIERLVKSGHEELLFSKTLSLFSAPGIPLFQLFMEHLLPSADAFYARAVDFTNPGEAAKQINAFVEAKSEGQSKCLLADIDPSAELLFAVDIRLAEIHLKQQLNVPMVSSGVHLHTVIFTFVDLLPSRACYLELNQPSVKAVIQLLHIMDKYSNIFFKHLWSTMCFIIYPDSHLSRHDHALMTPELLICFSLQVINKAFFKLASDGTDQPEDPAAQKEDGAYLDVTLTKPFLFAVFEKQSRAMLFLGRVVNPLHE
ncbi:ANGT protein, partial [Erythrocercus mccallii]|nr:ANGT protein [Erythrocercus mccallii]